MLRILLPVDGSPGAARATQKIVETIGWYKEPPHLDLLAVHLPLPHFRNMRVVVDGGTIDRYYAEECEAMLAPSVAILDAAAVAHTAHRSVGAIAPTIVEQAGKLGSNLIFMGTRGMSALPNLLMGSIATQVLHLAAVPVVLVR